LTGYLKINIGHRPSSKKTGDRKTLNFHWPKISLLALHTVSLELDSGQPVKSQKIDRKLHFFQKIFEKQKILGLKMTKKNSLQDSLKTLIPIFLVLKFLI
jgi:hypothetical protein